MIKLLCVGKIKDKHLQALINDYTERINHYQRFEVIEVKDEPIRDDEKAVLEKEGQRILAKIAADEYVITLDLHGKMFDSLTLAAKLDQLFIREAKITFVIGGSLGLSDQLRRRSNELWKLSDLTFLHQMTRLIVVEQLYRCFKINNNETYHK